MLYKPVYLNSPVVVKKKMKEPLIKMGRPPDKPPKRTSPPSRPNPNRSVTPEPEPPRPRIPMLICGHGASTVVPLEARRDVLAGKVDYYLVDDSGVTLFKAKHVFVALKLDKEKRDKLGEYSCVGAHQRFLPKREVERKGLGYRRKFLSEDMLNKGIYER